MGTKGEEIGVGAFSGKQRPAHIHDKKNRAGEARVFIRLSWWKFTIALFSFHLPLPTSHCIIPPPSLLSFLIPLSHEAPLPPRASPWPMTARDLQERRYKHTLPNPTNQPHFSCCVSASSVFKSFFHLTLVYALDTLSLITFFTCCLFFPCLWLHFSQLCFVSPPICSLALCSAPSLCPRPDIKGSMKDYVPSIHTCTHPSWHAHTHTVTNPQVWNRCWQTRARKDPKKFHLGRELLLWEVGCVSADTSLYTLMTLAQQGKGLKG